MDAKSILTSHAFLARVIESEIEARTRTDEEKDEGAR
jgi:hypothetical protein